MVGVWRDVLGVGTAWGSGLQPAGDSGEDACLGSGGGVCRQVVMWGLLRILGEKLGCRSRGSPSADAMGFPSRCR